jgi:sarcosine oxidase
MPKRYDAIVIGVGGMGSAIAYQLARRGFSVLGLEQFDIPHDRGSSHGVHRIIRLAYFEHPTYVPLLRRAYELWREIEKTVGEKLLVVTGSIDAGYDWDSVVRGSLVACEQHQLSYELLDRTELRRRFPAYVLDPGMVAVYQPDGGFILSERAIVSYVTAALDIGAEIHAREPVLNWEPCGSGVRVVTRIGEYRAAHLVLSAGAWISKLVPGLLHCAIPERQVLMWVHPKKPKLFRLGAFPVFNLKGPLGHFYGLPIFSIPGFKLGKFHHRNEIADPDYMDREIHREDEEVLREAIRSYFPEADGPTMGMKTCIFTNMPDGHFVLDRLPDSPQIAIAAGFSGHGFKFCSVVGEIMADLLGEGESRFDLSMFRLNRFLSSSSKG